MEHGGDIYLDGIARISFADFRKLFFARLIGKITIEDSDVAGESYWGMSFQELLDRLTLTREMNESALHSL
jgi:hypothetical protein